MLDSEFAQLFTGFERSAFRLETLPEYRVAEEADAFAAFLAGRPLPVTTETLAGWLELIARSSDIGKTWERVHAVKPELTPYMRFEFEWGYAYSAKAGERISVLEHDDPASLFDDLPFADFWLFDDTIAVRMEYDHAGRFLEANEVASEELAGYIACRDRATKSSISLEDWLARKRNA